ncbi:peptide deformylase [Nocardia asteroides]|uniref:peptide deformylase n=1 Tax=Nocardia asteroides TaxID=1824 RepID=UPI0022B84D7A|nr:peptide deformylase [Nocardia asteroides]
MAHRTIIQSQRVGGTPDEYATLSSSTVAVQEFDDSVRILVVDLLDTMHAQPLCVGLAAPQIGSNLSVAVVAKAEPKTGADLVLINPVLIAATGKKDKKRESCMSLWGLAGEVERRSKITVEYYVLDGEKRSANFDGYFARVIQHEIDHLNGVLFSERTTQELVPTDIFDNYSPIAT